MIKCCSRCGITKDITKFRKNIKYSDGYTSICIDCLNSYNKQRYQNNKEYFENYNEKNKEKKHQWYEQNKDKISQKNKENTIERRKKKQQWYEQNRDKVKEYNKTYNLNHGKEKIEKFKQKYYNDPYFKLNSCFSSNIYNAIKSNKTGQHWEDLVPYTLQELKEHLESQFDENMSWNNYGSYWEIDHIIPVNTFNFTTYTDREFQICWSLNNLRPLEKIANKSRPKDGSDISESIKITICKNYKEKLNNDSN